MSLDATDFFDFEDFEDKLSNSGLMVTKETPKESTTNASIMSDSKLEDLLKQTNQQVMSSLSVASSSKPLSSMSLSNIKSLPVILNTESKDLALNSDNNCPICFNNICVTINLECKHSFCFNCIKAIALEKTYHAKCPLCNQRLNKHIIDKILNRPHKLNHNVNEEALSNLPAYWFYGGRDRSWWAYDVPCMLAIEDLYQRYQKGEDIIDDNNLIICGMPFSFDFDIMEQMNESSKGTRRIKRVEEKDIHQFRKKAMIKGIAGLKKH